MFFNRKTKLDNEISHMNFYTNISKYYRWKHQDSWGNIISNCTVLLLQIWKHFADLIQRLIEKNFQKAVSRKEFPGAGTTRTTGCFSISALIKDTRTRQIPCSKTFFFFTNACQNFLFFCRLFICLSGKAIKI